MPKFVSREAGIGAPRRLGLTLAAFVAAALIAPATSFAQTWPDRPVRMIVPFAPGGLSDIVCRSLSEKLGKDLGQPFVVENIGGAGGIIGTETVATAEPDGYAVLCTSSSPLAYAPALQKSLSYDSVTSFAHAAYIGTTPSALVVKPSLPIESVQQLIDYAKEHPGELNYASSGVGANTHLGTELLKKMTGMDILHVPYQGGGPAVAAMSSGEVDLYLGVVPTLLPLLDSGAARVIATSGSTRSAALPDVPTIAEAGVDGFQLDTWYALSLPAGTPDEIVESLRAAAEKAIADPDVNAFLVNQGLEPGTMALPDLVEYIGADRDRWRQVAADAGIAAQ